MIQLKKTATLVVRKLQSKMKGSSVETYCICCCEFEFDLTEKDRHIFNFFVMSYTLI